MLSTTVKTSSHDSTNTAATQRTWECMGGTLGEVPNAEWKPVSRISIKSMYSWGVFKLFSIPKFLHIFQEKVFW